MTDDILNHTPADAAANHRAASVRLKAKTMSRAKGQRRHDFRIGKQPAYVDEALTHLNLVLMPMRPLLQIRAENERLRATRGCVRKMKSDAAVVTAGVITFGHEAQKMFQELSVEEQNAAYMDLAQAVARRLQTSLESLVVHNDESAPHAHFTLRGYADDGKPLSKIANRRVTSVLQDITAEIMQKYCPKIERGNRKRDRLAAGANLANTINKSVRQLHDALPAEIAEKEAQLAQLQNEVDTILQLQAKTAKQLARLEARETLSEKQQKTLLAYQNRLHRRQVELDEKASKQTQLESDLRAKERDLKAEQKKTRAKEQRLNEERKALARQQASDREAKAQQMRELAAKEEQLRIEREAARKAKEAALAKAQEAKAAIESARATEEEFNIGLVAITSIAQEASQGTLKRVDDGLRLKDPRPIKAASPRVQKALLPVIDQIARTKEALDSMKTKLEHRLDSVRAWLRRDDLTEEARRDGEDLLDDGMNGPG